MKILLTAVALAIGAAPSHVSAAPVGGDGVMTLQVPSAQAAAAPKAFVATSPPCGSSSDGYRCASLDQSSAPVTLPSRLQPFPAAGAAVVTWRGTVSCYASPRIFYIAGAIARSTSEYYLYMSIMDVATALNREGPDTVAVGEKLDLVPGQNNIPPTVVYRVVRTPVVLTRTFDIAGPISRRYRVVVDPSFLLSGDGGSSCSITGGVYSVQYVPR